MLWSGWYDYVLPRATGLTPEFADQMLLTAAREFCDRSAALREDGARTAVANAVSYTVPVAAGLELVKIWHVWYGNRKVPGRNPDQITQDRGTFWPDLLGEPQMWTRLDDLSAIRLVPRNVTAGSAIRFDMAVKPTLAATGLRDDFAFRFYTAIGDGALSNALIISGRPWTDAARSVDHRSRFDAEVARAHALSARGFSDDYVRRNGRRRFL